LYIFFLLRVLDKAEYSAFESTLLLLLLISDTTTMRQFPSQVIPIWRPQWGNQPNAESTL